MARSGIKGPHGRHGNQGRRRGGLLGKMAVTSRFGERRGCRAPGRPHARRRWPHGPGPHQAGQAGPAHRDVLRLR